MEFLLGQLGIFPSYVSCILHFKRKNIFFFFLVFGIRLKDHSCIVRKQIFYCVQVSLDSANLKDLRVIISNINMINIDK